MDVIVTIALATICFTYHGAEECHTTLLGTKNSPTPVGEFFIRKHPAPQKGYGGDVLEFYETDTEIYAIHRLWLLNPKERREERIKSKNVKDKFITNGCINVDTKVYEKLLECCQNSRLIVR